MRLFLVVPLLFSVGCLNEYGEYDLGNGKGGGGGGGGGGFGYSTPSLYTTVTTGTAGGGGPWRFPVAVGGSTFVRGGGGHGVGLSVVQDSPAFTLTEAPSDPGTRGYVLTANAPERTTLVLSTSDPTDELHGEIEAVALEDVRLVPRNVPNHRARGAQVAWHTSLKEATFELTGLTGSGTTRLVDISLDVKWAASEEIALADWDVLTLPATPNVYSVLITAGSFPQRQFPFEMAGSIDRIDSVLTGTLARVGDEAELCFHPMLGDREVVAPVTFDLGGLGNLIEIGVAPASNCRRLRATAAGSAQTDARALGVLTAVVFTIES